MTEMIERVAMAIREQNPRDVLFDHEWHEVARAAIEVILAGVDDTRVDRGEALIWELEQALKR